VLVNPANATSTETTLRDVEPAARAMGLQIQVLNASTSREINAAFASFVPERPDALYVGTGPFFVSRRDSGRPSDTSCAVANLPDRANRKRHLLSMDLAGERFPPVG